MKRVILICCFIGAICACGNAKSNPQDTTKATDTNIEVKEVVEEQGTVFYDITLEQALEKAKADSKLVLVNFHTKTCGPCKKMEKTVFPNPECGKYVNDHFVPITIDGEDGGTGQEIAKKYNILIVPGSSFGCSRTDGGAGCPHCPRCGGGRRTRPGSG